MQFVKDIPSAHVLSYSMWQNVGHSQQQRLPFKAFYNYLQIHNYSPCILNSELQGYNEGDERSVAMI